MTDPSPKPTPDPDSAPEADAPAVARSRQGPLAIWIRRLPHAVYVGIVLAVLVALLIVAMVLNPGDRVGPVQPATPPVGGPGVPAARL